MIIQNIGTSFYNIRRLTNIRYRLQNVYLAVKTSQKETINRIKKQPWTGAAAESCSFGAVDC